MINHQSNWIRPEIEQKIDALLAKMTLEEKAGQLTQLPSAFSDLPGDDATTANNPDTIQKSRREQHEELIRQGGVGSYLGVQGAAVINRLQKIAVEESRLGIPLIFGLDVIHGYRTMFPIPLAEACSWEPDLARRAAEAAAREASAAGLNWTFAPMVDIARDARWGRIAEGSGEDPYLGSAFAAARVQGFQGSDPADPDHLAACAKHYVAYGGAVGGRDYNTVEMALQTLHDIYLPPFKAAVDAGVLTLMSAFNDLNGVPASANPYTLTTVLRGQFGFKGFVVSDWNSIGELIPHGFAADRRDAARQALPAGADMDMCTESYRYEIADLVKSGALPLEVVDLAVRRVLRVKFLLGLFDNPYRSTSEKETKTLLAPEHLALAREAGRKAIVLLKNEHQTLPLSRSLKKLAVVGPLADSQADMLGSWSFTASPKDVVTILEGIKTAVAPGCEVFHAEGCAVLSANEFDEKAAQAVSLAQAADVVVAVVGETADMSGEAASRMSLGLPGEQETLLRRLAATGKPLVVVLVNGRPLSIPWVAEHASAILETWQLGVQAGHAVADVLFGDFNPSAKLAATFPYSAGQEPIYYNHPNTGRPANDTKFTSKYIDGPVEPLYPFGYGLSYTTFAYRDLEITPTEASAGEPIQVSVTLQNTGAVTGTEVAQLYIADLVASRVRPVKELKGFQKVTLPAGEAQKITFILEQDSLAFYNPAMQRVVEPGKFQVWVGPNSQEGLCGEFQII
ncbi:MAG TPA: beta-glucosidase BglX [Anaerolineaceae bacterium]